MDATSLPEKIKRKMETRGFHVSGLPQTELPAIRDITQATDKELGRLLTVYTAWFSYANSQLALAQVDEMAARHMLDRLSQEAVVKAGGKTMTEKRLQADMNEEVMKNKMRLMECKSYNLVLQAHVEGLEKQLSLISREITRRSRVESWENRDHQVQHLRS